MPFHIASNFFKKVTKEINVYGKVKKGHLKKLENYFSVDSFKQNSLSRIQSHFIPWREEIAENALGVYNLKTYQLQYQR